uniref:Uncharacterized protein n=1 Tax=Anguilla anguilla TaxID=7936 RepID=A0A0E9QLS7_ANGAN
MTQYPVLSSCTLRGVALDSALCTEAVSCITEPHIALRNCTLCMLYHIAL